MLDHGQSVQEWAATQKPLTATDREALSALVGVRTLGDLLAVLERGEVEKDLAAKIRKVIEREPSV
jgi:cell division FtsZ-interacting protein ZapD